MISLCQVPILKSVRDNEKEIGFFISLAPNSLLLISEQ